MNENLADAHAISSRWLRPRGWSNVAVHYGNFPVDAPDGFGGGNMSYGLYIGKNHTADGLAYLAGYGDEPSSHWLEIVPRAQHDAGAAITVGVTPQAAMPGVLSRIPQMRETARHLRVSYSHYLGVPAPLTNGGLNEHGVAVRDIWSTSRAELIAMTPPDQTGPNYSDLARIVLERARSAREGVEIIAGLIAAHGYSTYGGNSHIIADPDEAFVVIEFAGGQKLWVAERLGASSIRASRPGHIGVIDFQRTDDFLYPAHFTAFAQAQGWHQPGEAFDVNVIYGDGLGPWAGVQWIEAEMRARAARPEKISLADVMWAVRTPRLTGDTAGYGQVVPLHHPAHAELRYLWHTQTGAIAAPFVPVFLGVHGVPEEFAHHRYLTESEAGRFMDMRHALRGRPDALSSVPQGIESTRSAFYVFKRLMYLMLQHHEDYLPEVLPVWEAEEARLSGQLSCVLAAARLLADRGETELARFGLDYFTRTELLNGLRMAEQLADGLEARTRARFGFSADPVPQSAPQIW
ncbi:MAG: C69 family dipeptidase [Aestuariivirgaceae bacterium]|nr:C69 family dipeptidase [Aestuariivirgaceae bacterium]